MDVKKRIEICMLLEKMYNNREYAEKVGLQDNSYGKLVDDKRYERKAVRTVAIIVIIVISVINAN